MGAVFRRPPAFTPKLSPEILIGEDVTDPAVKRALESVQRTVQAIAQPLGKLAGHPTVRDDVVSVTLAQGTNWIDNTIGRAPRFVYVVPLSSAIPTWWWKRQSGDADRTRIDLEVTNAGPFPCLVRME